MSEPPAKITKFGSFSGSRRKDDEKESVEFYVHLCLDVLLEVLRFGDRRPLVKLERIGRRFHLLIEKFFLGVPFLRLNLRLIPAAGSKEALLAFIGDEKKEITLSELVVVPRFLRFDKVLLDYSTRLQSIAQKCGSFLGYLPSIKASLNDSKLIYFDCEINEEDATQFRNQSALVEHIRQIVSICNSSHGYKFVFLQTDSSTFGNAIASILEMPEIARSSFIFIGGYYSGVTQLPVETISNWLNRERNALDQKQRERRLVLMCLIRYSNIQEMCEFLKQKFAKDKLPAIPFNFKLFIRSTQIETATCVNETTNEQFSVSHNWVIEVKRTHRTASKRKGKISQP